LTLYRFVPWVIAFLARKVNGDTVESEDGPSTLPQAAVAITVPSDFRLLANSRPNPVDVALEPIKAMMAAAPDSRARVQIAACRRFVEQMIHAAYLRDADDYLGLFADRSHPRP